MMMKKLLALSGCAVAAGAAAQHATNSFNYPEAKKLDTVYDYAGTKVPDPYSWLENMDSDDTKAWVDAENKLTGSYLSTLPGRDKIAARLKAIINYERFGLPEKK